MHPEEHDRFWRLYNTAARPRIERACRTLSRVRTDNTLDPDDMAAWVDDRVWRMLSEGQGPTFHDDPSPETAVFRLQRHAGTLARWAHLALARGTWRRAAREQDAASTIARAQRLAMTTRTGDGFEETEEIRGDLERLRAGLGEDVRRRLAASWPEPSERHRVAMALDVADDDADRLIDDIDAGRVKENTVHQMRSRARRQAEVILRAASRAGICLAIGALVLAFGADAAFAGEQSGGRRDRFETPAHTTAHHHAAVDVVARGEQSGGRRR